MSKNGYQDEKAKESNKLAASKEEEEQYIDKDNKQDISLQQEKKRYQFFILSNVNRNTCYLYIYRYINFYEYV